VNPIGDGRVIGHRGGGIGHRAGGIGHQDKFLCFIRFIYDGAKIGQQASNRQRARNGSLFGDFNRDFRTIGFGKPRLVLKPFGHGAVPDFMRIAEFVEFEQFRRQRFAAGVSLTLVLVDVYFQFSGHGKRSPPVALIGRA